MHYLTYIEKLIEEQANYGKIENALSSKYGHLPHIAPEAYSIITFAPVDTEQIAFIEKSLNREIPEPYKAFLSIVSNGIHIFHRCLNLYGFQGAIDRSNGDRPFDLSIPNLYERPQNASDKHFFIGGYSYDGSLLYMSSESEKVFYCARRDANPIKAWDSFSDMLIEEILRLRTIHSPEGILQATRKQTLPIESHDQ